MFFEKSKSFNESHFVTCPHSLTDNPMFHQCKHIFLIYLHVHSYLTCHTLGVFHVLLYAMSPIYLLIYDTAQHKLIEIQPFSPFFSLLTVLS